MTTEELNIMVHNHLKNIENSLLKIKVLSRDNNKELHMSILDAGQCIADLFKEVGK